VDLFLPVAVSFLLFFFRCITALATPLPSRFQLYCDLSFEF
jgi:hypothetical protein